jgi:glycosyltransferase involved in cell wall biosynthesis
MKIVQAVGWYYPESLGGTEIYVSALSERLMEAGHEVLVAAPAPGTAETRRYTHDGISVFRYPTPAEPTRAEAQNRVTVRGAELFHGELQLLAPDVVHFHTFVTGLGLPEVHAAKAVGARVIFTTHSSSLGFTCQRGTLMQWGEHPCDGIVNPQKCGACELQHRGSSKSVGRVIASLRLPVSRSAAAIPSKLGTALGMADLIARNQARQRELYDAVDCFTVLGEWAANILTANGAPIGKLKINRLGMAQRELLSLPRKKNGAGDRPLALGYLGRFDRIKGVYDLAQAFASLPAELPVRLELRGPVKSEREANVRRDLQQLLRGDWRVTFAPSVPVADVPSVLAGYDVLCCPSICAEGGPTVAIEAHAVGTPVIGTLIGTLPELVSDGINGRLVPPGNWRELASVIDELARGRKEILNRWRAALPPARTMDDVTSDYLAAYQR